MTLSHTALLRPGYFIEPLGAGEFQSVFPADESELSQPHSSIEDARNYICEQVPDALVEVLL